MVWRTRFVATLLVVAGLGGTAAMAQEPPLRVALDGTFPPHAMPTMSGEVEGFNIDFAKEIAKRLGREVEITAAQFSGLIPGMQAGTYDFIVAPVTITEERAETLLFTEGYLNTDYQFIVKKGAPPADSLEAFKGKTVSVNKGSIYDRWARGLEDQLGWTVESYGTNTDAVAAVMAGRADANIVGNTGGAWTVKQNPQLELSYTYPTGAVFATPFRKDDVEMRDKVEAVVECMKQDGTMVGLSEKWLGVTPDPESAAVRIWPGYGQPGFEGHDGTPHELSCG